MSRSDSRRASLLKGTGGPAPAHAGGGRSAGLNPSLTSIFDPNASELHPILAACSSAASLGSKQHERSEKGVVRVGRCGSGLHDVAQGVCG